MTLAARAIWRRMRRRDPQTFTTFEAAAADTSGYESADLVDTVAKKTERLRTALPTRVSARLTVQDLLVLHRAGREVPLRVLDLGGACGATFFELDALASDRIEQWCVVDTQAMIDRARATFSTDKLRFTADLSAALSQEPDLVVAKGMLQYTARPLELLRDLVSSGVSYIYISRTPAFVDSRESAFIRQTTRLKHHGPGSLEAIKDRPVTVAASVLPWGSYREVVQGEHLLWEFDEGNAWTLGGRTIRGMGMLVHLR